jgi:elongation factor P
MISTGDFKKGGRILFDGEPHTIEDYTVQTPSARGAATLVRCKLRNVISGILVDRTFKSGDKFEVPDVSFRRINYLYDDGDACHFMDTTDYEQFSMPYDTIEELRPWLVEQMELDSVAWDGRVVGIKLPQYVECVVDTVGAGSRSDTASGRTLKEATLTNGRQIKVPLFIDAGEKVLVDPSTGEFVRRA